MKFESFLNVGAEDQVEVRSQGLLQVYVHVLVVRVRHNARAQGVLFSAATRHRGHVLYTAQQNRPRLGCTLDRDLDLCPTATHLDRRLDTAIQRRHLAPGPSGGLHLVLATREDPPLSLARLRARHQLTELRASDLRFTSSEAAEFLNQVMGLNLAPSDIKALETRTEGRIAGLQLAALALQGTSMQGRKDAADFIQSFTGSHRFVLDYLVEEVLDQQPASAQDFLLQTAVLDRLTGSLCDTLTGRGDGQPTLEMLEHANLFIVSLDEERCWYRYHHLFTDLLRQRLYQSQPERVSTLHRQAGTWFEERGLATEALRHIFAAGDFQWAGRLVEQIGQITLWRRSDWSNVLHWLERFPQTVVHSRPRLCLLSAWAMYASGRPEATEPFLRSVESHLPDTGNGLVARGDRSTDRLTKASEMSWATPFSAHDVQSMLAEAIVIRAFATRVAGDLLRAIDLFRRALGFCPARN